MPKVYDPNGNVIHEGAVVKVLSIPDWLTNGLPNEDVALINKTLGSLLSVIEIDNFGYVWLGASKSSAGWFCLKPSEVEVLLN